MQRQNKVYIVGIGYRPLDTTARDVLLRADVIYASQRLNEVFRRYPEYSSVRQRIVELNNIEDTISAVKSELEKSAHRDIVLLASGDPLFFGIGRRMLEQFGRETVEIIPDLSSIQVAFARIRLAWDDAFLMSLHGGPDPKKRRRLPYEIEDIPNLLEKHGKLAILTDRVNSPSAISKVFGRRPGGSRIIMHVCERLGYPDERVWSGDVDDAANEKFNDPNVVVLQLEQTQGSEKGSDIPFGLEETELSYSAGLITKDEIRAVTIHRLRLPRRGIFWDIGAGSGSVSLEAARLCPGLEVFAIEKDEERIATIKRNLERLSVNNVKIVSGAAPDVLAALPGPDRVFIGGSGGRLGEIIEYVSKETGAGIVVINAATIQTLHLATSLLPAAGFSVDVSSIQVSRSRFISGNMHMSPLNPVFVIRGRRV